MSWFFCFIFFMLSLGTGRTYFLLKQLGLPDENLMGLSLLFLISSGLCYNVATS